MKRGEIPVLSASWAEHCVSNRTFRGCICVPKTNQLNIHCLNVFISNGYNDMFPIYLLGFVKEKKKSSQGIWGICKTFLKFKSLFQYQLWVYNKDSLTLKWAFLVTQTVKTACNAGENAPSQAKRWHYSKLTIISTSKYSKLFSIPSVIRLVTMTLNKRWGKLDSHKSSIVI